MIALGALGIIGGGVCLAWGLPYLVLEQGFTYAIIGAVLVTGGVLLIGLGLLLRELRAMAGRIGGFSAQDAAAAIAAGAVAAGSAVAAGLVAGQAPAAGPESSGKDDAQGELPLETASAPPAEAVAMPAAPEADAETLPPLERALTSGPALSAEPASPMEPALPSEIILPPASLPAAFSLPQVPAWPEAASWSNLDELPAPKREIDPHDTDPRDPGSPDMDKGAHHKRDTGEPDQEEKLPLPEPIAPMPPAPSDDEDPFERLRRSLMLGEKPVRADALAAGMTADLSRESADQAPPGPAEKALPTPAAQDGTGEELAASEPEDHAEAVIAEAGADLAAEAEGKLDDEVPGGQPDGRQHGDASEGPAEPESAQPAAETPPPEGPAISEEGIVSVRRIGDSTYTMYADGSVKAETPDAQLHFATVAELKAHLSNPMR
jgi:hypothetical protein